MKDMAAGQSKCLQPASEVGTLLRPHTLAHTGERGDWLCQGRLNKGGLESYGEPARIR